MSESVRIAVPVDSGEGLGAVRSAHFGHAAAFAIVDVEDGTATSVDMLVNPPHSQGGCLTAVNAIVSRGVNAVSAVGMGRGPLNGLMDAGIVVYHDAESSTAGEAVAAIMEGRAAAFGADHTCQGH
jgi:predicted Fe-Mo cluster-binding NifX family protein